MKIFVTGLTSTAKGNMEHHNLGNYIIVEPLFKQLRKTFPDAKITTGMQMSDSFYKRHNITKLENKRFWSYGATTGIKTALDILLVCLWKLTRIPWLLRSSMLREIVTSDLVIDFSGDIYGDNAHWTAYLECNARLSFALLLNKNAAMIIGSPGPFSSFWRQAIAKLILPKLALVTNREPLSTMMLSFIGIQKEKILTTACPSLLFEAEDPEKLPRNSDYDQLFGSSQPTIGIILCGWNMPTAPYNRWPREDWEFDTFLALIQHIRKTTDYRICLMSHQNATNSKGELVKGADHRLIERLQKLLANSVDGENVFTLSGVYDAAQSKTIIHSFDLLISGRIHGAVQGMSQEIPTAIIDYGHHPKAHKLQGFARLYGVDDLILDPKDQNSLIEGVNQLVEDQDKIRHNLRKRLPKIKMSSMETFRLLRTLAPKQ